jgi:hypothetical protein
MNNKSPRTKIGNLSQQPRTLDIDELADVTGGLIRGGFGGIGGGGGVMADTWTWTDPVEVGELKKKDDE